MRPSGSGAVPASAALPLLANALGHCLRRGAWHLPARRSERDPCYYSDGLLVTRPVVFSCIAAVVVFAVVQDRLTVAGVGQYIAMYRDAAAGKHPPVTIDEVMKPAVARGVRQGAFWGGTVLIIGLGGTLARLRLAGPGISGPSFEWAARRRRRRE